ncbi:sister chromatid cohesion protein 1 [Xylographa trunciseda]|nr:sister chromatid cohesion protein 1 [Xylographa trunciseda]
MFYSETLLSKTGPLARVWLSANLEKKLNKTHIIQSSIESSVKAIVDEGGAPMALRLSGQLLLGVVRIYSRKARYLMDDCNDALLRIKMAFRPGNLDMPVNTQIPNPGLNMPEAIVEPEILPMLDESLLNSQPMDIDFGTNDNNPLNWTSQLRSDSPSIEQGRNAPEEQPILYEDDLGLDIDMNDEPSVEIGRHAQPPRSVADDLISEDGKFNGNDDLGLDYGDNEQPQIRISPEASSVQLGDNGPPGFESSMNPENLDHFAFDIEDDTAPFVAPTDPRLERDSQSPLSSTRSSVVRAFDETVLSEEPSMRQARQPASKKRKILPLDVETTLHSSQIKQQQTDRSAILRPVSFLPRDPVLLTLMTMQKNGGFVSNIMGEGRAQGWAPELRGILSIEVIRKAGSLKRKRDSGVADLGEEDDQATDKDMPQLEIPEDEDLAVPDEGISVGDDELRHEKSTIINLPADEGFEPQLHADIQNGALADQNGSDEEAMSPVRDNFEDTTAPLVHPVDQGPVSLGTQHAVHLLRDRFGASAENSPSQQRKANILFQDLLPEATTSKADATKMFFEVLVLATKDAVKVEQAAGELGGPIRIRSKRGLWGAWAEKEAGGEIAEQAEEQATVTVEA